LHGMQEARGSSPLGSTICTRVHAPQSSCLLLRLARRAVLSAPSTRKPLAYSTGWIGSGRARLLEGRVRISPGRGPAIQAAELAEYDALFALGQTPSLLKSP